MTYYGMQFKDYRKERIALNVYTLIKSMTYLIWISFKEIFPKLSYN